MAIDDDDDFEDREPTPQETRAVLRQVAAYRAISESIRKKSTGTLFFGFFMLAIWYFLDGQNNNWNIYSILYLSLALLEISAGLLNRLFPSPEGILLDGLIMFAFAASNGVRQYLAFQMWGQKAINPVMLVFGGVWMLQGIQTVRSYWQIRKAMPISPSRSHLRWFDYLVKELREADPKADSKSVSFPTMPFLTGRLLGDTAFFLDPGKNVIIAAREDVQLERYIQPNEPDVAYGELAIEGALYPPFRLSDANWQNFVAWKREAGILPSTIVAIPTVMPKRPG